MLLNQKQIEATETAELEVIEDMMADQILAAKEPNPLWVLGREWIVEELVKRGAWA